jgi:short-subunit dehydrogenase involved in D-alanine esterification of teichoic acids
MPTGPDVLVANAGISRAEDLTAAWHNQGASVEDRYGLN